VTSDIVVLRVLSGDEYVGILEDVKVSVVYTQS